MLLVAVLCHNHGLDGKVAESRRVDQVLCGHVVAIVLRVGERAALSVHAWQVGADAWAAIGAVLGRKRKGGKSEYRMSTLGAA